MELLTVEHRPAAAKLEVLGVYDWPIWERERSEFSWQYDRQETCYFLQGKAIVTPDGGVPVQLSRGDYVTFAAGLSCTWTVQQAVKKHYKLG